MQLLYFYCLKKCDMIGRWYYIRSLGYRCYCAEFVNFDTNSYLCKILVESESIIIV